MPIIGKTEGGTVIILLEDSLERAAKGDPFTINLQQLGVTKEEHWLAIGVAKQEDIHNMGLEEIMEYVFRKEEWLPEDGHDPVMLGRVKIKGK